MPPFPKLVSRPHAADAVWLGPATIAPTIAAPSSKLARRPTWASLGQGAEIADRCPRGREHDRSEGLWQGVRKDLLHSSSWLMGSYCRVVRVREPGPPKWGTVRTCWRVTG